MKAMLVSLVGVGIGFVFHRVLAKYYLTFIHSIRMGSTVTLRIVLIASFAGLLTLFLLRAFDRINLTVDPAAMIGTTIGGFLFGLGLAVAESCPATAVCSAGEGRQKGIMTLLGGLTGFTVLQLGYTLLQNGV